MLVPDRNFTKISAPNNNKNKVLQRKSCHPNHGEEEGCRRGGEGASRVVATTDCVEVHFLNS